jgi:hypothetical protein
MYRAVFYLWFSLLGGLGGGIATLISWYLLTVLFWLPYWRELAQRKMYVHDVGATYLVAFGWTFVGASFFGSTLLSLIAMTFIRGRSAIVYALNALPAAAVLLLLNPHLIDTAVGGGWSYPLAETSVLAIGFSWSFLLQKLAAGATDR